MKRLALLPALALAMAIVPFASALPAHAAAGDLTTVSITVSMDLPTAVGGHGPVVFQVTNVAVGAGPELTGADLVSNPTPCDGSLNVDVNNTDHTITVTPDDPNTFETATVTVTSPGLGPITLVSDNLWIAEPPTLTKTGNASSPAIAQVATMPLTSGSAGDTATMSWTSSVAGINWEMNDPDGAAIFSFTVVAPTTTTTTTTTTAAPTTTAPPAAAKAVQAAPAFTG